MSNYNFTEMNRELLEGHAQRLLEEARHLARICFELEKEVQRQKNMGKLTKNMLKLRHGLEIN